MQFIFILTFSLLLMVVVVDLRNFSIAISFLLHLLSLCFVHLDKGSPHVCSSIIPHKPYLVSRE